MSERIVIEIDDSQLDSVLGRLTQVSSVAKATTGSTRLDTKLPSINRELRLILGQLPGMRDAIAAYFRLRRVERGIAVGGASFWLTIIATGLVIMRGLQQMQKKLERERRDFERFVMKSRGFTREELDRERQIWKYYLKGQPK